MVIGMRKSKGGWQAWMEETVVVYSGMPSEHADKRLDILATNKQAPCAAK